MENYLGRITRERLMPVAVKAKLPFPANCSVPTCSGRIVTFQGDDPICITEEEAKSIHYGVEVLGICEELTRPEKAEPSKRRGCGGCGKKKTKDKGMRCDIVVDKYGVRRCIRCGHPTRGSYQSCASRGIGDRLMAVFTNWGMHHCEACSERRRKLNELDRWIYGYIWRLFHGKAKD